MATAAALAGHGLAQANNECTGAVAVTQGANGPFTNVGATTSAPAWPCAAGGADVWYSYIALGTGSLTADLCGAGYDTAMEIFDGTGGCGALTSLACNDDFCGLQSTVTVNVTVGTTYYIRVGGFASSTGTFTLNINGPTGSGTVGTATVYGTGCVKRYTSFYEDFATTAAFDLNNSGMTLTPTSPGYVALALGSYVPPTANATNLLLTDDSEVQTPTLSSPFPYDGGVATSLTVCSNGYVSVATGNGVAFTPSVTNLLGNTQTAWYNWHDFNPTASGAIRFEEIAGVAYITWDAVADFGGSSANTSTWQLQFSESTGSVTWAWQTMSTFSGGTSTGYLVGYSPGGASNDPGSMDLSTTLPGAFTLSGSDLSGLSLAAATRPVINTTLNLTTTNIPAATPFGAVLLGFTQFPTGIDLTSFGMAGCFKYTDGSNSFLFIAPGASNTTGLPLPNNTGLVGVNFYAQSATYSPAAALTLLGAISSNGVALHVGNL